MVMYQTGFFQDFLAYWVVLCLQYASNYHLKYREPIRVSPLSCPCYFRMRWLRNLHTPVAHVLLSFLCASAVILLSGGVMVILRVGKSFMTLSFTRVLVPAFAGGIHEHLYTYWTVIPVHHAIRYHRAYLERDALAASLALRAAELKRDLGCARCWSAYCVTPMRRRCHCTVSSSTCVCTLAIEQVRFRDRLGVEIAAQPGLHDAAAADMCLQPIVENAIRYGVARRSAPGTIRIRASRDQEALMLQVQDDGVGFDIPSFPHRPGIGLANTRARLETLHGGRAAVSPSRQPRWDARAGV
jgi:hypothetical protein